jgi:hypothetical protein
MAPCIVGGQACGTCLHSGCPWHLPAWWVRMAPCRVCGWAVGHVDMQVNACSCCMQVAPALPAGMTHLQAGPTRTPLPMVGNMLHLHIVHDCWEKLQAGEYTLPPTGRSKQRKSELKRFAQHVKEDADRYTAGDVAKMLDRLEAERKGTDGCIVTVNTFLRKYLTRNKR